jgi:hypothetical protein
MLSRTALAWQATLDRHYANPATAATSSPPTTPRTWWCARSATTDDATPNPNALAAQNLIRLAAFTGQHAWRDKADRLFDGIVASAGENLFAHLASLNALDLRLRAAEIVVVGEDSRADTLLAAARKLPASIASCCVPRLRCRHRIRPMPRSCGAAERRLRLCRRHLLAAGDEPCRTGRGGDHGTNARARLIPGLGCRRIRPTSRAPEIGMIPTSRRRRRPCLLLLNDSVYESDRRKKRQRIWGDTHAWPSACAGDAWGPAAAMCIRRRRESPCRAQQR